MKFVIVIVTFVAYANAGAVPTAAVPVAEGEGISTQYKTQDNLGNYQFGYDVSHTTGGSFHKESGSPGFKAGSYGIRDADGRVRVVNYVADKDGFRADVQTNEPGVEPKDPADVTINKIPAVVPLPSVAFNLKEQPLVVTPGVTFSTSSHKPGFVTVPSRQTQTTVSETTVASGPASKLVAAPLPVHTAYPTYPAETVVDTPARAAVPAHLLPSPAQFGVHSAYYGLPPFGYSPYRYTVGYPAYYNYGYPRAPVSRVGSYERIVVPQKASFVPLPTTVQYVQQTPSLHLLHPWDRK